MTFLWTFDEATDLIYKISETDGSVLDSFAAPSGDLQGLCVDPNHDLWVSDVGAESIYRLDPDDGTILHTIPAVATFPTGVSFDADGNLWCVENGLNRIYLLDPDDGSPIRYIPVPSSGVRQLAVDEAGHLWCCDPVNDDLLRIDPADGTVLQTISNVSTSPTGVGVDAEGDLWVVDSIDDLVTRRSAADGSVLQSFAASGSSSRAIAWGEWILNVAPSAPTLVSPIDNTAVDVAETQEFVWDFEDPDLGDSPIAYILRYRVQGTSAWTQVTDASSSTSHEFAGGTFTAGNTYEWQVRTTDTSGEVSPYSASEFFNAAAQPSAPTIDDPIADQVIGTENYELAWTTATQTAYRARVVADDGSGSPDWTTVLHDTDIVESPSTRSRSVPFPTDGVTRHVQVQTRYDGLWSDWASVRVSVSYTAPAVPAVAITTDDPTGAISIAVEHPAPAGTEPIVTSMDVQRRVTADGGDGIRVAADLAPGATHTDWTVGSGVDYEYRVLAYADNGTSTWSAWTGAASAALEDLAMPFPATAGV